MPLFKRRQRPVSDDAPGSRSQTMAYLREFATSRVGVEAYVEPATHVTQTTIMLVATDGEWTRRRVPDAAAAWKAAKDLGLPTYDVQRVGYPPRVRAWNAKQRELRESSGKAPEPSADSELDG